MFPFDNQIVTFKLNGYDLKKLIKNIQIGNYSFYPISGIKIKVIINPSKKVLNVCLSNGDEIDDNKLYKIVSVDYLINGGDDFRKILSWFKPIDIEKVGIISDEFIKFYKDKPLINVYDHFDEKKPRIEIVNSNFLS
jgi:2',3'-cyclic-nucleotide 2'-phosphodiesterase (5'-nucleotidase family)